MNFFKKLNKNVRNQASNSKDAAKERLHLVLMQDRANVSADFLELMKQEIIEVIKKYIDVDESAIDVKLTHKENPDGTNGAPALYANIPIINIKNEARKVEKQGEENKQNEKQEDKKVEQQEKKKDNQEDKKKQEDEKNQDEKNKEDNKIENKQDNEEATNKQETTKEENKKPEKAEN